MKRSVVAIVAFGVILACGIRIASGQNANTQMSKEPVLQGSILEITVTLDKAPNSGGELYVDVAPADGSSPAVNLSASVAKGQVSVSVSRIFPLEATLGKWIVKRIAYMPSAGQEQKDLTLSGDLSFQVGPHEEIIVPSGAKVIEIK